MQNWLPKRNNKLAAASVLMIGLVLPIQASAEWQTYRNRDRYSVQYPAELFEGSAAPDNGGITLYATDRRALLFIFGGANQKGESARQLANGLAILPDVYRVTYRRVAANWFVLSGYLSPSGDIFYERVELGPKGRFAVKGAIPLQL